MFSAKRRRLLAGRKTEIVHEAIAIIDGRSTSSDTLTGRGRAWISRLAHISWEDLEHLAGKDTKVASRWDAAASYLATDLLDTAKSPERFLQFQRNTLIPIELEMLAGRLMPPTTPANLVKAVDLHHQSRR